MGFSFAAPLAGRNKRRRPVGECRRRISIHAPLAGRDHVSRHQDADRPAFQSTRPLRGATQPLSSRLLRPYFNPRAPCGARLSARLSVTSAWIFQSTRPLRGATVRRLLPDERHFLFQSTRPLRGATSSRRTTGSSLTISIHAPLAGRDVAAGEADAGGGDFNPRAPCGARRSVSSLVLLRKTHISIHAPLAGRDRPNGPKARPATNFNPRAPCGARHVLTRREAIPEQFQSTRPLRGATALSDIFPGVASISIHAPLAGRDLGRQ